MRPNFIFILLLFPVIVLPQASEIPSDEESITRGRELFIQHCDRCHKIGRQEIGPSLASVVDKRPVNWLLKFIQSSQAMIASGDPYAVHLYRNYSNMVMPDFLELDDSDRLDILAYIKNESIGEEHSVVVDSLQYLNSELLGKAEHRYATVQEEEPDYYSMQSDFRILDDPEMIQQGQTIFEAQCKVCHDLDRRQIGPALASVTDRRPLPWLLDFLESPTEMLEKGDDYTNFLVTNYPLIMPDFGFMSQEDKLAVLAYIRNASGALTHTAGVNANAVTVDGQDTADLSSGGPKTGDMDEIGYNDTILDDEDNQRSFNTPSALLMGAVVLIIAILAWKLIRR